MEPHRPSGWNVKDELGRDEDPITRGNDDMNRVALDLGSGEQDAVVPEFAVAHDPIVPMGEAGLQVKAGRSLRGVDGIESGRVEFVDSDVGLNVHHVNLTCCSVNI